MKILITTDWYIPAVNGVVTSVLNLKRGLEKRKHEVKILTLSHNTHTYEKDGVIYVGSINAGMVYPGARLNVLIQKDWKERILEWKPDIVHSNCEFSTFFIAREISKKLDIPLLHTYHTIYENYTHYFSPNRKWGRKIVIKFSRWIAEKTNGIIAPTEKVKTLLEGYGISQLIYVIPTGIDNEKYYQNTEKGKKIRERMKIPNDMTVLVYIGRMAKEKNCEELLKAMKMLQEEKVMLVMVGDGPHKEKLIELSKQYGISQKTIFTGMISPQQVNEYYGIGDIFVSASVSETQGLTYIEALASGLVMLCREDLSLKGVIDNNENGWMYKDLEDFVMKLKLYLKQPKLQDEMKYNAGKKTKMYSMDNFAESMENVYEKLIEENLDKSDYKNREIVC